MAFIYTYSVNKGWGEFTFTKVHIGLQLDGIAFKPQYGLKTGTKISQWVLYPQRPRPLISVSPLNLDISYSKNITWSFQEYLIYYVA